MHDSNRTPSVSIVDAGRQLRVVRGDGTSFVLDAALVWRDCRSAAGTVRRTQGRAQPPADLRIVRIALIGHYAVNLAFSDGHDRGIYPWSFLDELAGRPTAHDYIMPSCAPVCGQPLN